MRTNLYSRREADINKYREGRIAFFCASKFLVWVVCELTWHINQRKNKFNYMLHKARRLKAGRGVRLMYHPELQEESRALDF